MPRLPIAAFSALALLAALLANTATSQAQTYPPPGYAPPPGAVIVAPAAPPPPQVEVVPVAPPGPYVVWRPGHWRWDGFRYVWVPGHYARPPHRHAVWIAGHWAARHHGWVWIEGHWGRR